MTSYSVHNRPLSKTIRLRLKKFRGRSAFLEVRRRLPNLLEITSSPDKVTYCGSLHAGRVAVSNPFAHLHGKWSEWWCRRWLRCISFRSQCSVVISAIFLILFLNIKVWRPRVHSHTGNLRCRYNLILGPLVGKRNKIKFKKSMHGCIEGAMDKLSEKYQSFEPTPTHYCHQFEVTKAADASLYSHRACALMVGRIKNVYKYFLNLWCVLHASASLGGT